MPVNKSRSPKPYLVSGMLMILFALVATYLPQGSKTAAFHAYVEAPVSPASVRQEFFNDPNFNLQQLHGVKILNRDTGKFTYYFEYLANKKDTLRRIAALPFLKDNRITSTACELMNTQRNPLDHSTLTQEERDATSFFWDVRADDFTFYECYKSPVKHTLLLSKTSDRILHKVEIM